MSRYLLLILFWIAWCTLHSALIAPSVMDWIHRRFPHGFRFYRIFFNTVAMATLVPVLVYAFSLGGPILFAWQGPWRVLQLLLVGCALWLFAAGSHRYDFFQFLGLRQLRGETSCGMLTEDCSLDTSGVLSMVRHPWYTGGMLIIWARPLDLTAVLTNIALTGYFIVGAHLEERKLRLQFGGEYAAYQRRVSMFFPIRWARGRWLGGRCRSR